MQDMPALASKFSKTMPFRQKMYRIRLVYHNYTYNIVFYDYLSMFNNNEDIWEKHAFLVRNFSLFGGPYRSKYTRGGLFLYMDI